MLHQDAMKKVPDTYFAISLGMSLLLHFTLPVLQLIPYPFDLLSIGLIITGLGLVYVTNSILLKRRTSIKALETPSSLVTSGPFKFSRNPIYLGMAGVLFGTAVLLGSLSAFVSPILFMVIMHTSFIPAEERSLEKSFGEEYRAYKARVGRWC